MTTINSEFNASELPPKRRPSGGRASRRKGDRFEREVVALLQARGLAAERVPLSGAVKTSRFDHDVTCPVRGIDRRLECKISGERFRGIDGMLAGNYALVCRGDRSRALVVMTLEAWAELARTPAGEEPR